MNRSDVVSSEEAFLFDECAQLQIACASARSEFSAGAARGEDFATDRHWGPAGHRASARALARLLRDAGLASASER